MPLAPTPITSAPPLRASVPLPLTHSRELAMPASESAPVLSKVEVALAPKYAFWNTESCVVEAPAWNCCSVVQVLAVVVENELERTLFENERPLPSVSAPTAPVPLEERMDDGVPEIVRLVVLAVLK